MDIEKNLNGGKFKKLLENAMMDAKNRTNLNRVELEIIYLLSHYKDLTTLTDICRFTQMNKGHMSTNLDKLVKQGYVICSKDSEDRRCVRYELTKKSEQICREMEMLWTNIISKVTEGIDEDRLLIFNQVSEQINRNIDKLLKKNGELLH